MVKFKMALHTGGENRLSAQLKKGHEELSLRAFCRLTCVFVRRWSLLDESKFVREHRVMWTDASIGSVTRSFWKRINGDGEHPISLRPVGSAVLKSCGVKGKCVRGTFEGVSMV